MARKRKSLSHDIYMKLHASYMEGRGRDHRKDKKTGDDVKYIYSTRTYQTYREQTKHFSNYAKEKGARSLSEARQMVGPYLQSMIDRGLSGSSVRTAAAALGKVYGVSYKSFGVVIPSRSRAEISNNRGIAPAIKRKHLSEETAEKYGKILRCIGLRRKEALLARGRDLIKKDGHYYVHIPKGKGGKERTAVIQGTAEEVDAVVQLFETAGDGLVWPSGIPSAVPVHRYRAEYAERVYRSVMRPIEGLSGHDRYYCRNEKAGLVYDRQALVYASKQLGHNRCSVVAGNYLH